MGLDVIIQVPLEHPTNFQYKKPASDPMATPIKSNLYLLISVVMINLISILNQAKNHRYTLQCPRLLTLILPCRFAPHFDKL